MGSTSYATQNSTPVELRLWMTEHTGDNFEILKLCIAPIPTNRRGSDGWGRVGYAAAREKSTGKITMWVSLAGKTAGMFYVKDQTENMGPSVHEGVPLAMLDMLTPTDNDAATSWRAEARAAAEAAKRRGPRPTAKQLRGKRIRLPHKLTYPGVGDVTEVVVESGTMWRDCNGDRALIPPRGWLGWNLTVLDPEQEGQR